MLNCVTSLMNKLFGIRFCAFGTSHHDLVWFVSRACVPVWQLLHATDLIVKPGTTLTLTFTLISRSESQHRDTNCATVTSEWYTWCQLRNSNSTHESNTLPENTKQMKDSENAKTCTCTQGRLLVDFWKSQIQVKAYTYIYTQTCWGRATLIWRTAKAHTHSHTHTHATCSGYTNLKSNHWQGTTCDLSTQTHTHSTWIHTMQCTLWHTHIMMLAAQPSSNTSDPKETHMHSTLCTV